MRIAQVAPLIFPVPPRDHGGTERVVHDLTHGLVAAGHDVTLFAADGSRVEADGLPGTLEIVPQGPPVATVEDAPPSLPSAMECVMLDRVAARADGFDIVHCHTELYHAAVLRAHGRKLVTTIHWRADERDRVHYFDHFRDLAVVAISDAQSATLPASNRAGTVHHGIPRDRLLPGQGSGGYCAFLGRMTDQKRPDRAIAIARGAGMAVRLGGTVDVGNPQYFTREVEPLLGADARYVGPVTDAEKQAFLGEAAVLLFPIDWPEPFGLVMIEAMACGTPVVAFRHGSVAEVVENGVTGFVVDTMEEAVAATERARALDRGRVRARFEERFEARHMVAGYERVYRERMDLPS